MNILIYLGHPRNDSFCDVLASEYKKATEEQGAKVKYIRLADLKFDPLFLKQNEKNEQPLEPDLKQAQEDILWADHVVMVYPIWWGGAPALLKGFIDRVFTIPFSVVYDEKGIPRGQLKGKSSRLIVTMDAPPIFQKLMFQDAGIEVINKCVLKLSGFKPAYKTKIGPIHKSSDTARNEYIKKMLELGKKDASH